MWGLVSGFRGHERLPSPEKSLGFEVEGSNLPLKRQVFPEIPFEFFQKQPTKTSSGHFRKFEKSAPGLQLSTSPVISRKLWAGHVLINDFYNSQAMRFVPSIGRLA